MTFKVLGGMSPTRRCGTVLALITVFAWGCGGDGGNPAPGTPTTPGTTGNPDGGAGGTGGAPVTRDGGARDVPVGPGQSGTAVAKFCNGLRRQSGPIEFTLELGTPPVRFVAASGKCTPAVGQPCVQIPAGPNVTATLYLDGMPIGMGGFEVPAGQDVVFEPVLVMQPNGMQALSLEGSVYPPGVCPDIDLVDVGDGGAPPGNADGGSGPVRPPGI